MPVRFIVAAAMLVLLAAAPSLAKPAASDIRVGFDGQYKLGCWTPVRLTLTGIEELSEPCLEIVAPDGDGSPAATPVEIPTGAKSPLTIDALTRVGRIGDGIQLRLLDGDRVELDLRPKKATGHPSTSSLVVQCGAANGPLAGRGIARVAVADLPTTWEAYEGVDVLVISTTDPAQLKQWSSSERVQALFEWVNRGGKVLIAGGANAARLIGEGAPLQPLSHGKLVEVIPLARTGVIEDYASSERPLEIDRARGMPVARLSVIGGKTELEAGGGDAGVPLVVRRMYGFGEVTFVAFDLDTKAIAEWKDREFLFAKLLRREVGASESDNAAAPLVASAFSDLSGAVHVRLGRAFQGVTLVSVFSVVGLAILYLLLIGPGTYYFGRRVLGVMQSVWITFPLIALAFGAVVLWWSAASTGERARINTLQVIDVESSEGLQRGALWASVYSPAAETYDLALSRGVNGYLTWYGLAGEGVGGMQTSSSTLTGGRRRYDLLPTTDGLQGAPINRRGSKAICARWLSEATNTVQFDLTPTNSGLVEGVVLNETDLTLVDCKLVAGDWAWRLPTLRPGGAATIDGGLSPAKLRTLLLKDFGVQQEAGMAWAAPENLSTQALAHLMMFHATLGGDRLNQLGNRYQSFIDLSHAIQAGRPILVARCEAPSINIYRNDQALDDQANHLGVFYRFVGPAITTPGETDQP